MGMFSTLSQHSITNFFSKQFLKKKDFCDRALLNGLAIEIDDLKKD